jgi:hypothetical protein
VRRPVRCAQRLTEAVCQAPVPQGISRGYTRDLEVGPFQPMIDSWDLHLRAERKSAKTIRTYLEAAQWFAGGYLIPAGFAASAPLKPLWPYRLSAQKCLPPCSLTCN